MCDFPVCAFAPARGGAGSIKGLHKSTDRICQACPKSAVIYPDPYDKYVPVSRVILLYIEGDIHVLISRIFSLWILFVYVHKYHISYRYLASA